MLTIIGTIYIWVLSTKKNCTCKLCKREIELVESIGEGGFGAVYLVQKKSNSGLNWNKLTQKFILKKLEMKDLNELERVQYEAK